MEMIITLADVSSALLFILPSYAVNSVPAVFGGGTPIDFGKHFVDGQRIFGSHKTIKGFAAGLLTGLLVSVLMGLLISPELLFLCTMISIGALLGDLGGAFIKRRMKHPPGYPLPLLDQLDFVLGGLLVLHPFHKLSSGAVFLVLLFTPAIHLLANMIAYVLKIKRNFW
jgi:CDP-2,3-bis-(O-geranylgeranyl)-sn-glycerol synthase